MRCKMRMNNTLVLVGGLILVVFIYLNTSWLRDIRETDESTEASHEKAAPIRPNDLKVESKRTGEELLSVYILARHGARTPLHLLPGVEEASYAPDLIEPFVLAHLSLRELNGSEFKHGVALHDQKADAHKLKGGAGRGRLTKVGEKQLFDLGLRLREKYIKKLNFIADKYDHNEMFVRSTHYLRTIDSAKSFLTGFYGRHPIDLNDYAYIIHVKKYEDDTIFPNPQRCKYLNSFRERQLEDKLYKNPEYVENLKEMYATLGIPDQHNPSAITDFRDDFAAREVHDQPIPANLKPLIKKYDKYAAMELAVHVYDEDVRLTCGPLLNEFKEGLVNVIKNNLNDKSEYHKFNYYSNHDSTIMAVLLALGLVDDNSWHWPPFASTVTFELWRDYSVQSSSTDYSGYFIRVFYCEKPVELPGCSGGSGGDPTKCSVSDFLKIVSKSSATPFEFDALCGRPYHSS